MGLSMKYLVHSIPEKWLKKEQGRKLKQSVILKYKDYIGGTEKYDGSGCQNKLFHLILIGPSNEHQSSWKNKKTNCNHPKNRRQYLKCHKTIKSPNNSYKTCEKERIFVISIVNPGPESGKEKERRRDNHSIIHISPKERPEKVSEGSPWKA